MRDECWLTKPVIDRLVNKKICLKIGTEDVVTIRIRKELLLFFKSEITTESNAEIILKISDNELIEEEGYCICEKHRIIQIEATDNKGLLHGLFAYAMDLENNYQKKNKIKNPSQKIRMIDHWDNFDGSIERGYAGESIFYKNSEFRDDLEVVEQYARLIASVGINRIVLNNVNVHELETYFIGSRYLNKVKLLVEIFESFGITCFLSINFAAPIRFGDLKTADPLNNDVAQWWKNRAEIIYDVLPNFGGFLVKADSEGEPGPFAYGRNHADGANMLAKALEPYGGQIIWRTFVYNHKQDWRDRKTDRARSAFDNFIGLDGDFSDNVILQMKFGPMDFQVREAILPLFGRLKKTNHLIEFQVTQEYTGHQLHINYLPTQWVDVLGFDTKNGTNHSKIKDVIRSASPNEKLSGFAAVCNVGMDLNWTGNKFAQANLYGYARLGWDSDLSAQDILNEWIELSVISDRGSKEKIFEILNSSNQTYENYTSPLGVGWMVNPSHHYGPSVDGYEYDRWGTYHFADRDGIGVDRTVATGSGYTRQYNDENYEMYENLESCPDNLLLFFHHVGYGYQLKSGKTVIQHIYDTHFEGYANVENYIDIWNSLDGKVEKIFYENVKERLAEQERCAREWKDQVNTYFLRKSGIGDNKKRVIYK